MKIFLFGKNGQLGSALYPELSRIGEVVAFSRAEANFEDPEKIADIIRSGKPDIIINAAAATDVDLAESQIESAFQINAGTVKVIAEEARDCDAWLIHYSTDYVFDGKKEYAYCEEDTPNPINIYGASKLAGDNAVMNAGCKYIILRCSWLYGLRGKNFPSTMLRLSQEKESLQVVNDQFGVPTSTELVASITTKIIDKISRQKENLSGLYNLAPSGRVSWHEYALFIVGEASKNGLNLTLQDIHPISSSAYGASANRPLNSCLNCKKIEDTFDIILPEWQADVVSFVKNYMSVG